MIRITSFSYKGGAGRTVASANIAAALASKQAQGAVRRPLNYKVALIDLDVFSAGTHRAFEISNEKIQKWQSCIQDYLHRDIQPAEYVNTGGITVSDPLMDGFRMRGALACRDDFKLFPAKPKPTDKFKVQKFHDNNMSSLLIELENQGFDYAIIDGESGTRDMAEIAVHVADVVLMFFRLTWQHIEGSMVAMKEYLKSENPPRFYLIPTCVPLVGKDDGVYQLTPTEAPGLDVLRGNTETIPEISGLNEICEQQSVANDDSQQAYGHFWSRRMCIHDSLVLKGEERVLVCDPAAEDEQAATDYYEIAAEISRLHAP
jgi:cellulose biosynthesis protein BcsQ